MNEAKIRYLEMIQGNIDRMFRASFNYKALAVTSVTATLGAAFVADEMYLVPLSLLPLTVFWALDGYHLEVERRFRRLYSKALAEENPTFSMIPMMRSGAFSKIEIIKAIFSPTLNFLYMPISLAIVLMSVHVLC